MGCWVLEMGWTKCNVGDAYGISDAYIAQEYYNNQKCPECPDCAWCLSRFSCPENF